jgi:transposase
MKAETQSPFYAGFDFAKDHHDVVILDAAGKTRASFRFDHTPEGWKVWKKHAIGFAPLQVAVETSSGIVIEQLLDSPVTVYALAPQRAKQYREMHRTSGAKDDRHDAWSMAAALRADGHTWRPLLPLDPIVMALRLLCRDEVALIEERTALVNQLQQALLEYFPTALECFDDWTAPSAWAFIETFPTPEKLRRAGKNKWEKFLHTHKLYRPQTRERRQAAIDKIEQLTVNAGTVTAKSLYALAKVRQLKVLEAQLDDYRTHIEELFAEHPDHEIYTSLPGAGPKLGPRLCAELGTDRNLFPSAESLQCVAGTAPVTKQTGKVRHVQFRKACNKHLRHALHQFADHSRDRATWAEVYYLQKKAEGKTHPAALRCLAQRWVKIIWKMWQERKPYDPEIHQRNQTQHGSWVLQLVTPTPC